jgi:membrane protein
MLGLREFISDLKSVLGPRAFQRVGRKVLDDNSMGLAGQLAYFTLLSLFPFLLSLVVLAGLVTDDSASLLKTLTHRMQWFVPGDAVGLLEDYIDLTLRGTAPSVLLFGIPFTAWSGWAAANAIVKAVNRAYDLRETRPWWKLWGISVLMIWGFMLMIASLALVVFGPKVGGYVRRSTGLPEAFLFHVERPALGVGVCSGDLGSHRPLLRSPERQGALQMDHSRRICGHDPGPRRERGAEPLRG